MSCGPDTPAQEELEEVCGQEGPFRVLALDPDQQLVYGGPLRVGDRLLFEVSRVEPVTDGWFPQVSERVVWSTGLCGESPVQIADGVNDIFQLERWPEVVLGCVEDTGDIVTLDPLGVAEPHVVFPGDPAELGCALRWTDHGAVNIVAHDEDFAALVLTPYPDDPLTQTAEPVTLLDSVRITPSGVSGTGIVAHSIRTFPDFVLAIDSEDALVRVELADRAVTTLREGVRGIEAARDGSYVLGQDLAITKDDPKLPQGELFLRDMAAGSEAALGEGSLRSMLFPMTMAERGLVQVWLSSLGATMKRLFFLPGLDFVDVPAVLFFNAQLDDGRMIGGPIHESFYDLIDLKSGESRRLFPRPSQSAWFDGEAMWVYEASKCCIEGDFRDEGPFWRVPIDGEPERVGKRANHFVEHLEDGRFIGPVGIGDDWLGTLVVIDPATQEERHVDDRVAARSLELRWGADEGLISYSVSDGERSGVYVARLSQVERSGVRAKSRHEAFAVDVVRGADGQPVPVPRSLSADGRERRAAALGLGERAAE